MSLRRTTVLLALFAFVVMGTSAAARTLTEEEWAAVSLGGARFGYVHTVTRRSDKPGSEITTSVFSESRLQRFGAGITLRTSVEYREAADGALLFAHSRSSGAGAEISYEATAKGEEMVIVTRTAGQARTATQPRDPEVIGPFAQMQKIRASGFAPGVEIAFKAFLPEFQRVVNSTLKIEGPERLTIGDREMTLQRGLMQQDILPGMVTTVWLDEHGNVVRSLTPVMGGVETVRVSRKEALRAVAPQEVADVMTTFLLSSNVSIAQPTRVVEALYRIQGPPEMFAAIQLADRRQTVESASTEEVRLRVRALGDAPEPAERPIAEFLAPSAYVQSDDPEIARIAREETARCNTPAEKARALEQWVHKSISTKDFSVGFASAKETLLSREGDCTEHAVLLAALLRAVEIPSRVAVGLVYWKGHFGYHMWTEAFLNDWTALDATLDGSVVDATHIKLTTASLATASASEPFLSLVHAIGKMRVEVLEVRVGTEEK